MNGWWRTVPESFEFYGFVRQRRSILRGAFNPATRPPRERGGKADKLSAFAPATSQL